jgi:glutamate decarboxylase
LEPDIYFNFPCIVFRVVLANPLTTVDILSDILAEQRLLAGEDGIADEMAILNNLAAGAKAPA